MMGVTSSVNGARECCEDLGRLSSPCLSVKPAFINQLVNIDSLPVEMIQKIATYLPTRDYDNFRATNRVIRDALISINGMYNALEEQPHRGAQGTFYKTCVEAKQLEARCNALTDDEMTTLLNIAVRPEPQQNRAISIQCQYPVDDLTINDGIMEIVEEFCKRLRVMNLRDNASSGLVPSYQCEYNICIDLRTFDIQAEVIFHTSNVCELSHINNFYAHAHQLYEEYSITQRIFLTAMMAKLYQFWHESPPANLGRQKVDQIISPYVTLLRSGNDVLAQCMTMKINNAG